ncbi:WD40 repeat-like protein [Athelia psychrophila]|uniref:WD40 repeat-like protein n=1 Tax=Athelia psychrophila TaxID=1759441 RepID=A0A166B1R3_9AGAM|nr:WD40 repeat-like protein [Fibularhizoctonia sp. CBS 109695]
MTTNVDARNGVWNTVSGDQHNTYNSIQTNASDLDALRKASAAGAGYNSNEREPAPKCLPGTRSSLLDVLQGWAHADDEQSVCWLDGPAGSGKSAISQTVAEACAGENILAASFFFSRKHAERSNASRFFPTLALQLSISVPEARDAIRQAITDNPLLPDEILHNQYEALIAGPILGIKEPRPSPMIIIIDALDECEDEFLLGEILSLLIRGLRDSHVRLRVLIASRPLTHIEQEMTKEESLPCIRRVELQKFRAEDDIRIFLRESFTAIYDRSRSYMDDVPPPWPSEEIVDGVVDKTSGLFIFATTVINFVNPKNGRPDKLLARLMDVDGKAGVESAPFAGVDRLYLEILSSIKNNPEEQFLMRTIIILFNPLSINDLARLLAKSPGEIRWQLRELQSVIAVSDDEHDPVRIFHASFRDFLLDPRRSSGYCIDRPVSNGEITRFCLKLMTNDLKRDPCNIRDPSKMNRDVKDLAARCSESLSAATQYACRYWASHLSKSDFSKDLVADLEAFFAKSLLYWLEALSLLGKFDEITVSSLHSAREWIKNLESPLPDVLKLIEDAERLVLEFFDPITESAMHLYHSALPFLPTTTHLRRVYAHEIVGVISVQCGLQKTWGKLIRVIRTTGPVRAINFSPDATFIASRSDVDGLQLWRSATGAHFVTLGGGSNVSCYFRFSFSGTRIAMGAADGKVWLWDVATGVALHKAAIKHTGSVTALSFSRNSATLASSSSDKTICLWDALTGHFLTKLEGHTDGVTFTWWSPDDSLLASSSLDHTILLWNTETYRSTVLKGHKNTVWSVLFSSDGKRVVSASEDKTARVWDVATSSCIRIISSHKKSVSVARFCNEGDTSVLTTSRDMTVQVYDLTTRKSVTLWSFSRYYDKAMENNRLPWAIKTIASIAGWTGKEVGKAGFTLVSSHWKNVFPVGLFFGDQICVIRDTKSTTILPPYIMNPEISTLAFSSNGSRLAIGSHDNDISIHDPSMENVDWSQVTTDIYRTEILSVADDGSRLLTMTELGICLMDGSGSAITDLTPRGVSLGNIVRKTAQPSSDFSLISMPSRVKNAIHLFDGRTGAKLPDLVAKGLFGNMNVAVFSPDGQLLVAGCDDGALKLWSRNEMKLLSTLEKIPWKGEVKRVAFSPDGKSVAAATEYGAVLCWNFGKEKDFTISPNPHPKLEVTALVYTPDSLCIVSGASDGSLRSWHLNGERPPWQAETTAKPIKSLSFQVMPDCFRLYCRSELGAAEIWEFILVDSTKPAGELDGPAADPKPAAESEETAKEPEKQAAEAEAQAEEFDPQTLVPGTPVVESGTQTVTSETKTLAPETQMPAGKPEKLYVPRASWRTNPGCIFADQPFDSNISLGANGWLVDGESRLCWLPKYYRPHDTMIYYRAGRISSTLVERGSMLVIDFNNVRRT